ncbi:hypothetical protein AC477_05035, partial [miscellaneous Crenarchaeota group-1 archaeon SG8-32-1]
MSQTEFKPHKISKGIQLPGFWLVAIVTISGAFLFAAINIENPDWVTPTLVIAAIVIVIVGLIAVFVLQTKFRPHLLDDKDFIKWLSTVTSKERPEKNIIPSVVESEDLKEIKCNESLIVSKQVGGKENNILYLMARINYSHEAGSAPLMSIKVNDEYLLDIDLINKPPIKIIADGRMRNWFEAMHNSWQVIFSPNFKDNYFHRIYKV